MPISITGAEDLIGGPKRPVRIAFHTPLAAPVITSKTTRRQALDAFDDEVMSVIAPLLVAVFTVIVQAAPSYTGAPIALGLLRISHCTFASP